VNIFTTKISVIFTSLYYTAGDDNVIIIHQPVIPVVWAKTTDEPGLPSWSGG
jgi:hypothetical protein